MSDLQAGAAMAVPKAPGVRRLAWGDIADALKMGLADFGRAPAYGLFFGGVFALGGLALVLILSMLDAPWMILPIMIGFPLVGPFAAAGLYEVSRRLEKGEALSWKGVLFTVFEQRERQLGWMAFVTLFIFWIWIFVARILVVIFMGFSTPATLGGFLQALVFTQGGLMLLVVGTLSGAVLALFLFSVTLISMPLLLDQELDFVTAMITSFKAVRACPLVILGWGVIATILCVISMLPAFLGLVVVLPVLGHATWHIYKKATVPAA